MGDYNQAFLDHEVTTLEEAQALSASLVAWLIDTRIIEDRPRVVSDNCLDHGIWYPPGPRFMDACLEEPPELFEQQRRSFLEHAKNELRVIERRAMVLNMQGRNAPIDCPCCGQGCPIDEFWRVGYDWCEGTVETYRCVHCGRDSALPRWEHPDAAFVMVGLEFWNWWGFNDRFKQELQRRLGHRMTLLYGKF